LDAKALAQKAGAAVSANVVMVGALAQSGVIPIPKEAFEETIRTKTKEKFVDVNLKAFELGFEAA
jgi:indolepyruvate ferredoxin oxidoreductase beta subunit